MLKKKANCLGAILAYLKDDIWVGELIMQQKTNNLITYLFV